MRRPAPVDDGIRRTGDRIERRFVYMSMRAESSPDPVTVLVVHGCLIDYCHAIMVIAGCEQPDKPRE